MKVAFILDHALLPYRVPLFNALAVHHEVTIFHRGPAHIEMQNAFSEYVFTVKKFGPFVYFGIPKLHAFDLVIQMQNLRVLNLYLNALTFWRRYRLILWGIGVSSSGGLSKKRGFLGWLRDFISLFSDGIAFYSAYPLQFYSSLNRKKSVVVGNSIFSPQHEDLSSMEKDSFLFIGRIVPRKGLNDLIDAFVGYLARNEGSQIKRIVIIGDGPDRSKVEEYVQDLGIAQSVQFVGDIREYEVKKKFFSKAVCMISPKQAGLSVVESFAFGVPVITSHDCITGGEAFNIVDGINGYFYSGSKKELEDLMVKIGSDEQLARELGHNAYRTYDTQCSFDKYVASFLAVIDSQKIKV